MCADNGGFQPRQSKTPLDVRRSYFGPVIPKRRILVEPPGTAPGSDPLITSAFMSIVPKDTLKIEALSALFKRHLQRLMPKATTATATSEACSSVSST